MTELEKLKMDDEYINQNDIVKRYLQNKLTPEETVEFEEYMLDKPELLERLELDMVLVETLPRVEVTEKKKLEEKNGIKPYLWQTLFGKPFVYSICSFFLGALVISQLNNISQTQALFTGTINLVEISPLRSTSSEDIPDAVYSLSNNADYIILMLQPEDTNGDPINIEITRTSDGKQILNEEFRQNSAGEILVMLRKNQISLGRYSLAFSDNKENVLRLSIVH